MPAPSPELRSLLVKLLRQFGSTSEPVPLATWAEAVSRHYANARPSTRYRAAQAAGLVVQLAGSGATTAVLVPGLLANLQETLLGQGYRYATINGHLRALRTACNLAVEWGYIDVSPYLSWSSWLVESDETPLKSRYYAREDIARVLAWLRVRSASWTGHRLYALAMVYAYTGVRYREALKLEIEDIDLGLGTMAIRRRTPKGLKTRGSAAIVPMPDALVECLTLWLPRTGCRWVFPGQRLTGPWLGGTSGKRAGDQLRIAGELAGVPGLTPHTLRHSLATWLRLAHGLEPSQVQLVLRHSSQLTQRLYVHRDRMALVALVKDFRYQL